MNINDYIKMTGTYFEDNNYNFEVKKLEQEADSKKTRVKIYGTLIVDKPVTDPETKEERIERQSHQIVISRSFENIFFKPENLKRILARLEDAIKEGIKVSALESLGTKTSHIYKKNASDEETPYILDRPENTKKKGKSYPKEGDVYKKIFTQKDLQDKADRESLKYFDAKANLEAKTPQDAPPQDRPSSNRSERSSSASSSGPQVDDSGEQDPFGSRSSDSWVRTSVDSIPDHASPVDVQPKPPEQRTWHPSKPSKRDGEGRGNHLVRPAVKDAAEASLTPPRTPEAQKPASPVRAAEPSVNWADGRKPLQQLPGERQPIGQRQRPQTPAPRPDSASSDASKKLPASKFPLSRSFSNSSQISELTAEDSDADLDDGHSVSSSSSSGSFKVAIEPQPLMRAAGQPITPPLRSPPAIPNKFDVLIKDCETKNIAKNKQEFIKLLEKLKELEKKIDDPKESHNLMSIKKDLDKAIKNLHSQTNKQSLDKVKFLTLSLTDNLQSKITQKKFWDSKKTSPSSKARTPVADAKKATKAQALPSKVSQKDKKGPQLDTQLAQLKDKIKNCKTLDSINSLDKELASYSEKNPNSTDQEKISDIRNFIIEKKKELKQEQLNEMEKIQESKVQVPQIILADIKTKVEGNRESIEKEITNQKSEENNKYVKPKSSEELAEEIKTAIADKIEREKNKTIRIFDLLLNMSDNESVSEIHEMAGIVSINTLLLTYPSFLSSKTLFESIKTLLTLPSENSQISEKTKAKLEEFCIKWLNSKTYDTEYNNAELKQIFASILKTTENGNKNSELKNALINIENRLSSNVEIKKPSQQNKNSSISLPQKIIGGKINPEQFSEELRTVFENLHKSLTLSDLASLANNHSASAVNRHQLVEGLSFFVINIILSEKNQSKRNKLIHFFAKATISCFENGNFEATKALLSPFSKGGVAKIYENALSKTLKDKLNTINDQLNSIKTLKEAEKKAQGQKNAVLSFLGNFITEITGLNENYQDDGKTINGIRLSRLEKLITEKLNLVKKLKANPETAQSSFLEEVLKNVKIPKTTDETWEFDNDINKRAKALTQLQNKPSGK